MQNKWTQYFLTFLHEWGLFILFISLFLLTRLFLWLPVQVEGHSMDPTLADGQRVIVLKHTSIERFDIVVVKEVENGKTKQIVKRIIGMPGDTITYQNDKLTVNGKEVKEEYLKKFQAAFAKDKLQKEYAYSDYFQQLAKESNAFTVNADKNTTFSVTVPEGKYYLLGDNRIVSKDSREVGYFDKSALVGEVKFRFWPLDKIGTVEDN
ncbi:signal peptidase I [Streptococcus thermophilus]|uniref:Signal peptidase I n=1 Tax=Streptococcus thermophilus TaxID=1308 RepID=A0A7U7C7Y0_STRTR|nr:signal peptidase I [Streptococcus thermophilus]CAD0140251.1 Signal peptidase I [Streptococcus thermophilus]CAD0146173.1 Signal peptidase I [Streptococcus thermophilus]CAD0146766.1 Signal peptidase I [Streptococcus thermophilus]CAD0151458.1 Signal peptidase I [Streptococcus thermophilus]CAD0153191.1 Signal peptidase I [Streptococcus thermophilus]